MSQLSHFMNGMTLTQWLLASMAIMPLTVGNDMLLFFQGAGSKVPLELFTHILFVFPTPI